jgi:putative acyl-CoA dehydrogenase
MATHEVFNQPPPLDGYDVFAQDAALAEGVSRSDAAGAAERLSELGRLAGSDEAIRWGFEANAFPPRLETHDRFGRRRDRVEYHPSYHRLMDVAVTHGLHAATWVEGTPGPHVERAAAFSVWSQVDSGHGCPISMTYAVYPALRAAPELLDDLGKGLTSRSYDPSWAPAGAQAGILAGMGMTEKQGGSDVRANTTTAVAGHDGSWRLTGHKWFCSAPNSDLWLMLAQAPGGLSCFLVPRFEPDGTVNPLHFQRLKDKLGNRSNASAEVELDAVFALPVGEEGRGVATIVEMVNHTRLDCVIGATSGMRQAVSQATHHAAHRAAFGTALVDQPLMRMVLADLAVESEAATLTMLRLASAYDRGDDPEEAAFRRLATAVSKYWVCKRHPVLVAEALECLGGNGYVEESIMPRLLRESPLNGIWEGSGNVICLDVLRAMGRSPQSVAAFMAELSVAAGADARLDMAVARLGHSLADRSDLEARARMIVEAMALCLQGSLLVRFGHPAVADAFCSSRLTPGGAGLAFGTLPARVAGRAIDVRAIIERATPKVG